MTSRFIAVITLAAALIATPALALELHQARSSGMVGELNNGYVTARQPSAEVGALVADVNARRKQEYARISKQNGQPVDVVAKLAAAQIIGGLDSGSPYQDTQGNWKTR